MNERPVVNTRTHYGAAVFMGDKFITAHKSTVISLSDVRETGVGLVDFGWSMAIPGIATEAEWRAAHSLGATQPAP